MRYGHFGAGFHLGGFFCLLFALGVILFLVWAVRTLDKKQLKKWVIGLLVVGVLGMAGSSLLMAKFGDWDKDGKGLKFKDCLEQDDDIEDEA